MSAIQIGSSVRWAENDRVVLERRIVSAEAFKEMTEEAIQRAIRDARVEAEAYPLREPPSPRIGRAKQVIFDQFMPADAPIAIGIMGLEPGDRTEVETPAGVKQIRIMAVG